MVSHESPLPPAHRVLLTVRYCTGWLALPDLAKTLDSEHRRAIWAGTFVRGPDVRSMLVALLGFVGVYKSQR